MKGYFVLCSESEERSLYLHMGSCLSLQSVRVCPEEITKNPFAFPQSGKLLYFNRNNKEHITK